ncbi:hypothetical protein ANN_27507 [Periplaneta americana]|uniref:Uncharacterized protein n=1 Tax=Periplaneta americana TaxID=6978 RepID=A0ABQ8RW24_PERAM|nr:hypothetical protein ANN_27507 [Periplaneta americana]
MFNSLPEDIKNHSQNPALFKEWNLLDEHMTGVKMEYVDQSHDFASEVKFEENPEPTSFPIVKDEPEERNFSDQHVTGMNEEYEDHSQDLTTEMKFEKDPVPVSLPVVKCEPEEQNFTDQHVTGMKKEYKDQSQDLTTEIKFEEDPVPISFPVVKREPEEEQRDLDAVNEEPRVEGTAEDNEIFTEWIAATKESSVSSDFGNIADEENETVCDSQEFSFLRKTSPNS